MSARSIRRLMSALLAASAGVLFNPAGVMAEEPLSPDAIEGMAKVINDRDPRIQSIEVRGYYSPFNDGGRAVRFYARYRSPDEHILLLSLEDDAAAFAIARDGQAIIYDPTRGSLLLLEDTVGGMQIGIQNDALMVNWGFTKTGKSDEADPAMLQVDLPSLVQYSKRSNREAERLADGTYRLTQSLGTKSRIIATVNPSLPYPLTALELESDGRRSLTLQLQVNEPTVADMPPLPKLSSLRARFKLEKTRLAEDLPSMLRVLGLIWLPPEFGATSKHHDDLEKMLGIKPRWKANEAQYNRDLPKLRQLFPMVR